MGPDPMSGRWSYLALGPQFASGLQPIAIVVAMPLLLIGVILGLMIGCIMLMGLVTKKGILLGHFANQELARAGTDRCAGQRRRGAVPADHHDDARNDLRDDSPWASPLRAAAHSVCQWPMR